jgi:hypothetical protein
MYDTTIAGKCCSRFFAAITETPPRIGQLIACQHCGEPIELADDNAVVSEMTQAEYDEFREVEATITATR